MLAALAGVVHNRQRADGHKHNRDEDNKGRATCSSTDQGSGKRRAGIGNNPWPDPRPSRLVLEC